MGVFNIFGKQCGSGGLCEWGRDCVGGGSISYVAYNSNIIINKRTTEATLGLYGELRLLDKFNFDC